MLWCAYINSSSDAILMQMTFWCVQAAAVNQKFSVSHVLHQDGNQEQTLIETLLPHVVQHTISLMNTNLGTHSWHQVSFSFTSPSPNCRGAPETPLLVFLIFIIALSLRRWKSSQDDCWVPEENVFLGWWVVKLARCSIDEHSSGISQGLIIWRVWIMLFSQLCQGGRARQAGTRARERESEQEEM